MTDAANPDAARGTAAANGGAPAPDDAPAPAAPASAPAVPPQMPWPRVALYMATAVFIALTQGLAQGWTTASVSRIAGEIGATPTEASWLAVAFMIPKTALPVMLIKIRMQYGLRRFAEIGIVAYMLVTVLSLFGQDLRSAITVQVLAGISSAPLSTLAFLYMLEGLPQALKLRIGLPMVLTFLLMGPSLARVVAPVLMADGDWQVLHVFSLGMALVSLMLVFLLPLRPVPHMKVIAPMDILSFVLIAVGFAGLTAAFTEGPQYWWTEARWVGFALVAGVAALSAAAMIELNRTVPLIDVRWILSPPILHLTAALLLFRLLLSEQAAGAPRMFQALGLLPDQLIGLFSAIIAASIAGGVACCLVIKPNREAQIHLVALVLIAVGAFLDSHSTVDTRPVQMIASQSMIAFAGALFLPPAMMVGLMQALAKGPNYLLSFIIVFLTTQSIGGTLGSGIFTTFINHRQLAHLHVLSDQMAQTAPLVSAAVGQRAQSLAASLADTAARRGQAVSDLAQEASRQAYVLAYNDAYLATSIAACAAIALLLLHLLRDRLAAPSVSTPVIPSPTRPA